MGFEGWGFEEWGAQKVALFLLSPTGNFILSSLSWGFLVEFWWCLKRRDTLMYAFGVLWLSCEAPAARSSSNTNKIQREDPQREKKERNFRREREKKERNFARSRGRAVRRRGGLGERPKNLEHPPHTQTTTTNKHQQAPTGTNRHQPGTTTSNNNQNNNRKFGQNIKTPKLAKFGLAKCGEHFETLIVAKCGLANGHDPRAQG